MTSPRSETFREISSEFSGRRRAKSTWIAIIEDTDKTKPPRRDLDEARHLILSDPVRVVVYAANAFCGGLFEVAVLASAFSKVLHWPGASSSRGTTMKLLLTMTPCRRMQFNISNMFPVVRLGIGFLSSYLEAHGYPDVQIVDMIAENWWVDELSDHVRETGPYDMVGLSTTALSMREAFELATAVKSVSPAARVVVGGPGAGFDADPLMTFGRDVDFFIRGEGEGPLLALVQALERGASLADVPSLVWRDGETVRENPAGGFRDLNDGVRVDLAAQPYEKYKLHPPMGIYPPATMVETTRGCSFPCEFCCLRLSVRYRSPENVQQELKLLRDAFGMREIHFVDPTFTLDRARTWELAERTGKLGLKWTCKTRVDLVDDALARHMAENGCYYIAFGVESGDDTILRNIQKKTEAQIALDTFEICRRYRIRTAAYLLVANPGETDETVDNTIRFVRKLRPDYVLYGIVFPDPLNTVSTNGIDNGYFTSDDLHRYFLTDEPTTLSHTTAAGHPATVAQAWLKRASADFYVRPRYFWQRIRDLRTLQDAVNLGIGGKAFFSDLARRGRLWEKLSA